jgi:predicted nicotinamide N-methyase
MKESKTNEKDFYKEESQTVIKNGIYVGNPKIQTSERDLKDIWVTNEHCVMDTKIYSTMFKKLRNMYYDLMFDLMSFTFVNGKTIFKQQVYDIKVISEIEHDKILNRYEFILKCKNENIEISVGPDKKSNLEENRMEFIDWYKTVLSYKDMFENDIYFEI